MSALIPKSTFFTQSRSTPPICKGHPRHAWIKNKETTQCSDFERLDDVACNLPADNKATEIEGRDTIPCSDFKHLDDTASNL